MAKTIEQLRKELAEMKKRLREKQAVARKCPPCPQRIKKSSKKVPMQRRPSLQDDLDFYMRF